MQYGPHHVQWLRDQFAVQMRTPHRFVCLTDTHIPGVETLPLQDDLPGWWSKMELFREFKCAAYVDLDTVIIGDVSAQLFNGHKFTMSAHLTRRHGVNSSVMSWNGDYRFLYDKFIADKHKYMAEYVVAGRWGDQDFIKETLIETGRGPIDKFQHKHQDFVLSYRYDFLQRGTAIRIGGKRRARLPPNWREQPRIVAFHGNPKPEQVDLPWVPKLCAA